MINFYSLQKMERLTLSTIPESGGIEFSKAIYLYFLPIYLFQNLDNPSSSSSINEVCFLKKQKISDGENPALISIESVHFRKQSKMHRSNFYDFLNILSKFENFEVDQTKFENIIKGSLRPRTDKITTHEIQILYSQNFQLFLYFNYLLYFKQVFFVLNFLKILLNVFF